MCLQGKQFCQKCFASLSYRGPLLFEIISDLSLFYFFFSFFSVFKRRLFLQVRNLLVDFGSCHKKGLTLTINDKSRKLSCAYRSWPFLFLLFLFFKGRLFLQVRNLFVNFDSCHKTDLTSTINDWWKNRIWQKG